ncbi:MAG: protoporphyrinogen/coproporphyrinogen oxidase [Actinomycetota bacterium]
MSRADLVVLGAGPAGVGAAYRAATSSRAVTVLERAQHVGGASASFTVAGQRVDTGSHRLHPSINPEILDHIQRALGGSLQKRPRNGRIRLAGRWIGFPLRSTDLLAHLPRNFAVRAAFDAATSWRRHATADTFAEVIEANLGPTMAEGFYFPYARKLWGLEPEEISGEQARRRVAASSPLGIIKRLLSGTRGEAPFFFYPRAGFGAIVEALASKAAGAGADLRLGLAAESVELHPDRVRVTMTGGESVEGERVWSTIPLTLLARIVAPSAPPDVLEAASSLSFRSMLLVYLVLDVDRYTDYDAHYLPESFTPVTRISEPKNYRDGDDPAGRTVLCAEIPCGRGDELWSATDETLANVVTAALRDAELPPASPSSVVVKRLGHAYPVYRSGYERAYGKLDAWAASHDRLLTFGRQGLFVHDNSHHAYAMAWAAADALRDGGGFDQADWRAARERFAEHVVED